MTTGRGPAHIAPTPNSSRTDDRTPWVSRWALNVAHDDWCDDIDAQAALEDAISRHRLELPAGRTLYRSEVLSVLRALSCRADTATLEADLTIDQLTTRTALSRHRVKVSLRVAQDAGLLVNVSKAHKIIGRAGRAPRRRLEYLAPYLALRAEHHNVEEVGPHVDLVPLSDRQSEVGPYVDPLHGPANEEVGPVTPRSGSTCGPALPSLITPPKPPHEVSESDPPRTDHLGTLTDAVLERVMRYKLSQGGVRNPPALRASITRDVRRQVAAGLERWPNVDPTLSALRDWIACRYLGEQPNRAVHEQLEEANRILA